MPKDYSPFTPGQPVPPEFFVGRTPQVHRVTELVRTAVRGRQLRVGFLTGERGIGKSSLAALTRVLAHQKHSALGLHVFLGGVSSLEEMTRRVFDRLLKESQQYDWFAQVRSFFGDHVREVGLFGVSLEFRASSEDLRRLGHDFAPSLRRLLERLQPHRKALFLILDDINGLAESRPFAHWLKSFVDEVATADQPLPLVLLLVGLEERRQTLINLQPSLGRVFDLIDIPPWSDDEAREFFEKAFAEVDMTIEHQALETLVRYTGGLPVLAHEIGDAVFKTDEDGRVDQRDAMLGIVMAAEIVGRKLLQPQIFRAIRSPRYRAILRKIARRPFAITFRRADVLAELGEEERRVLDNFLNRMKRLGVIEHDPEAGRGAYRFSNRLHFLYFWLEAERAREEEQP